MGWSASPLPRSGQIGTSGGQVAFPTEPPLPELDLQAILEAWPRLPAALKKAMTALVAAAAAERAEDRLEATAP